MCAAAFAALLVSGAGEAARAAETAGPSAAAAQVAAAYRLTLLPLPAGASTSVSQAIAANGDVTGTARIGTDVHAVVWRAGGAVDLSPTLAGRAVAYDIAGGGTVAGVVDPDAGPVRATLWSAAGASALQLPPGATDAHAIGLNDAGTVAGDVVTPGGYRATVWSEGAPALLSGLGGGVAFAQDVNAGGVVVGSSLTRARALHAVRWAGGAPADLGTLGGPNSLALAVNSAGLVVGQADRADGATHAAAWEGAGIRDLGTLPGHRSSAAFAVTDGGVVAGISYPQELPTYGVLWDESGIHALTPLVAEGPDVPVTRATGVNDAGQVAVTVWTSRGQTRAALLTPISPAGATPVAAPLTPRAPDGSTALRASGAAAAPGPATTVVDGSVAAPTRRLHPVTVTRAGTLTARLQWAQPGATLALAVQRRNGDGTWTTVTRASGPRPVVLTAPVAAGAWRLAVTATAGASGYTVEIGYPGRARPAPPLVTLLFSRSAYTVADDCVRNDTGAVTLDAVAGALSARGLLPTGTVETGSTLAEERYCSHFLLSLFASWRDLAELRDRHGWTFVSHGRHRAETFVELGPAQQWDESCGSLIDLRAHGHDRGDGLFAYPNNRRSETVQQTIVARCFAFGRAYGVGVTSRAAGAASPYIQSTSPVSGGRCNVGGSPCASLPGVGSRYALPSTVAAKLTALGADEWLTLQVYVLVTGSRPGLWDCTAADPRLHWTADHERYCWTDYLRVLDAIPAAAVVTDPRTVAVAWGRTAYAR